MGVGTFPIQNPTIGGGTAFNDIVARLLGTLSSDQFGRASVGTDVFSGLLNAELAARRRPVGIVDQLLLANEFGSVLPLSQLGDRNLSPRTNPALGQIFNTLQEFISRAVPGESPQTAIENEIAQATQPAPAAPTSGGSRGALLALQQGDAQAAQALLREEAGLPPVMMQAGGTLTVDPRRARTAGRSIAGPATVVDRIGQTAAVIGEGGEAESVGVGAITDPGAVSTTTGGVPRPTASPERTRPQAGDFAPPGADRSVFQFLNQPRDVTFRIQQILETGAGQNLSPQQILAIAQRPEAFGRFTEAPFDPRVSASRLLGGAITQDQRFANPLVRSLARGRPPTAAEITAQEFAALPPDLRDALVGIIGEDQLAGFLFSVGQGTPTGRSGVRQAAAGGVRV